MRRSTTLLAALLVALTSLLVLPSVATASPGMARAASYDRDCGDFANQRDAQIFFLNAGGPWSDPHRLDSEGDGLACETLPCPCYYSTSKPQPAPEAAPEPTPQPKPKPKTIRQQGYIVRVVDGDTVYVRLVTGARARVRMLGIDAPELSGRECGSSKSRNVLRKQLPYKTRVTLTSDTTQAATDKYGRLLRYVTRNRDAADMSRAQIRRGMAEVYVVGRAFKRAASYKVTQRSARRADRGIWGAC